MSSKKMNPLLSFTLAVIVLSCASKKESDHGHDHVEAGENEWREMDSFHMIMAESFHPYRDSADLEPARSSASALMTAANEWASAPLPRRVDNDEMRSKLETLKAQATTLAESVQAQDDNAIGEHLKKLHDTFHEIEEAWYDRE